MTVNDVTLGEVCIWAVLARVAVSECWTSLERSFTGERYTTPRVGYN